MKRIVFSFACLAGLLLLPVTAVAQNYSIDWFTIDGGGGASTGGVYSVSGTIGQPDSGKSSGGSYTLEGGFWSTIAVFQVPGAPPLSMRLSPPGVVIIS